jgi:heme exporter protein C
MILRVILALWMAGWTAAAFLWAPLVPVLGETTRVLYFHVPVATVASIALGWSMLHSALYLARRRMGHDDQAAGAAELGILFCLAATITGSIWARAQWGSYWNWDPRETSIFFLLLVYAAYLALRGAIDGTERRARLAAIYSIAAFVTVPFLMYIVPRMGFTLHPDPIVNARGKVDMDPRIRIVLVAMLVGFTALFFWMLSLRTRLARLERAREHGAEPGREAQFA